MIKPTTKCCSHLVRIQEMEQEGVSEPILKYIKTVKWELLETQATVYLTEFNLIFSSKTKNGSKIFIWPSIFFLKKVLIWKFSFGVKVSLLIKELIPNSNWAEQLWITDWWNIWLLLFQAISTPSSHSVRPYKKCPSKQVEMFSY